MATNPLPICPINNYSTLGCFNQFLSPSFVSVSFYANITKVPDYHSASLGSPIDPYERPNYHPACISFPTCGDGTNDLPYCNQPTSSDYISCGTPYLIDQNCYNATTTSVNYNVDPSGVHPCKKAGMKSVVAYKAWQGRYGYQSDGLLVPTSASYDATGFCIATGGHRIFGSPDQTKYRTLSINSTYTNTRGGVSSTSTYQQTTTVDRYSGIQTLDSCNRVPDDSSSFFVNPAQGPFYIGSGRTFANLPSIADADLLTLIGVFLNTVSDDSSNYVGTYDGTTVTVYDNNPFHSTSGSILQTISNNFVDSFQVVNYGFTPLLTYGPIETITITTTNDTLYYSYTADLVTGGIYDAHATCSLTNPYTGAELYSDWIGLQGNWNLNDDFQYPWREDSNLTMAPRIYYSEQYIGLSLLNTGYTCSYVNPNGSLVDGRPPDGSVYGKPLPLGYQFYWDGCAQNIEWCLSGLGNEIDDALTYGQYCPSYYSSTGTTATPTRWTNIIQGGQNYPSAFLNFQNPVLIGQKWVEAKQNLQSYNFIRPCGWDRWSVNPNTSVCIEDVNASGSHGVSVDVFGITNINDGDYVYLYGFSNDGVYIVDNGQGTTTFNLTNQNWVTLPSGYDFDGAADTNTGFLATMRFPSCPGTCGRVSVTNATQIGSGSVQITIPDGSSIQTNDSVNLYNIISVGETTSVNVSQSIDSNNFIVNGTLIPGFTYTNAIVESVNSVTSNWADNAGKGYYLLNQWTFNNRDIAQYVDPNYGSSSAVRYNQTINAMPQSVSGLTIGQYCSPLVNACRPYAMGFSPNGDFSNNSSSNVLSFPNTSSFLPDGLFGSQWMGQVQQAQQDWLWIRPKAPCYYNGSDYETTTCAWNPDNGQCYNDVCVEGDFPPGNLYFPQPNNIEAINLIYSDYSTLASATLFSVTVPTPPEMVGFYPLSYLQSIISVISSSNVLFPPVTPGVFQGQIRSYLPIWTLQNNEIQCVCSVGRWADLYNSYGSECVLTEFGI